MTEKENKPNAIKTVHITPGARTVTTPFCGAGADAHRISQNLFIDELINNSDKVDAVKVCRECERKAVTKTLAAQTQAAGSADVRCDKCRNEFSLQQIGIALNVPTAALCWNCITSRFHDGQYKTTSIIVSAESIAAANHRALY